MEINRNYSKYGVLDGIINIIMIIILALILNKYKVNIISIAYIIFTMISIFIHFKIKGVRIYKSRDKINLFYSFGSISYFKFSQIIIITLMIIYFNNDSIVKNSGFNILLIIYINIFINFLQMIILLKRSYITEDNKIYLNHRKLIDFKEIKNIKKNLSKIGGNSIYIILKNNKKIKTEVTKKDYEYLKGYK